MKRNNHNLRELDKFRMTRSDAVKRANALRAQYDKRKTMNCKTAAQRAYLKRTQAILFQEIEDMMTEHDIHHSELGDTK